MNCSGPNAHSLPPLLPLTHTVTLKTYTCMHTHSCKKSHPTLAQLQQSLLSYIGLHSSISNLREVWVPWGQDLRKFNECLLWNICTSGGEKFLNSSEFFYHLFHIQLNHSALLFLNCYYSRLPSYSNATCIL